MANSSSAGNGTGAYTGGIPLNVTLHAWPIPKYDVNLKQPNETNPVMVKNNESAKNYTNSLHNLNATGYVAIDDDLIDTGFTDVQTFILAGIATVIPLLIIVASILGIRFLWRKLKTRKGDGYEGVLQKDESSEPLGKLQGYSLPHELKTSESQFTVTPGEDFTGHSPQLMTPKSNGSVITMTLKNNHLIVETEETANTPAGNKIESKGTTTKFVTSTVPDFKVNFASQELANYTPKPSKLSSLERGGSTDDILSSTNHGALVHCPPEETEDEPDKGSCNTGMSQSDLSVSSTESQNPSYRYGNQSGYDSGGYGYPEYSGYSTQSNHQPQLNLTGPKYGNIKIKSLTNTETNESNLNEIEATGQPLKDILLSDIQARKKRVEEDEQRYQEEQRVLGNGELFAKSDSISGSVSCLAQHLKENQQTLLKNEISQVESNKSLSNDDANDIIETGNES